MPKQSDRPALTERQRHVMELLDRRVPIKVIAAELQISDSRVNQHISALKRIFAVSDLTELIAAYRAATAKNSPANPSRSSAWRKNHLPLTGPASHDPPRVADGELVLADVQSLTRDAPWVQAREPRIVPRALDGNHAVIRRLAVMVGLAASIVAALILVITAAVTMTDLFAGVVKVPEEQINRSE